MGGLEDLVRTCKVLHLGISDTPAPSPPRAADAGRARGREPLRGPSSRAQHPLERGVERERAAHDPGPWTWRCLRSARRPAGPLTGKVNPAWRPWRTHRVRKVSAETQVVAAENTGGGRRGGAFALPRAQSTGCAVGGLALIPDGCPSLPTTGRAGIHPQPLSNRKRLAAASPVELGYSPLLSGTTSRAARVDFRTSCR